MAKFTETPRLSFDFTDALEFAHRKHWKQIRKDEKQTPYIAHLLAVSSLVLEADGDEIAAIAALLHDVLEDTSCTVVELEEKFGAAVSAVVQQLSENKSLEKAERKLAYAKSVLEISDRAVLVSLADKLHNLRGIAGGQAPELITEVNKVFYLELIRNLGARIPGMGRTAMSQLSELRGLWQQVWKEEI